MVLSTIKYRLVVLSITKIYNTIFFLVHFCKVHVYVIIIIISILVIIVVIISSVSEFIAFPKGHYQKLPPTLRLCWPSDNKLFHVLDVLFSNSMFCLLDDLSTTIVNILDQRF